jgi:beta-lactamase class A
MQGVLRKSGWAFLAFGMGLVLGLALREVPSHVGSESASAVQEVRAGGFHFINPLLECEIPEGAERPGELKSFRQDVEALVTSCLRKGMADNISVYFRDLNDGPWFAISPEENFAPASLLKVPILITALRKAERDPSFLKIPITLPPDFAPDKGQAIPPLEVLEAGKTYTVEELLRRMIVYSDNRAVSIIDQLLSTEEQLATFRALGVGFHESATEPFNLSVASYASFFRILFNASYLNRDMSERALSLLASSRFQRGIRAGIPGTVTVAEKFGHWMIPASEPTRQELHDCGIVYYPGRPYLLAVMTRGNDIPRLDSAIRLISAEVFRHVDEQTRQESSHERGGHT